MSIDIEYSCSNCDDDQIVMDYWQGHLFNYTQFRCVSCNENDWISRSLRVKHVFRKWVNSGRIADF